MKPKSVVTTTELKRFGKSFKREQPKERFYKVKNDNYSGFYHSWVVKCKFNPETLMFDYVLERDSMYVAGSSLYSIAEFSENSLLLSDR